LATNSSLFKEPPYRLSNSSGRFQWNRVTRGARHATGRSPSAAYLGQAEAGLHTLYGTEPKHADPEDQPEVGFSQEISVAPRQSRRLTLTLRTRTGHCQWVMARKP
jgi:hypothetical protein